MVVFILSLMLALVLPSFKTKGGRLRAEARKVASIVRYVNDSAATRKTDLTLKFDLDERTITWAEEGKDRSERFDSLQGAEVPSRGLVKEGELIIFFSPLGPGEHLNVHLALEGEEMLVSFNPITRRAKITDGKG